MTRVNRNFLWSRLYILSIAIFMVGNAAAQSENKALTTLTKEKCATAAAVIDPAAWDKSFIFGLNLTDGNSNTFLVNGKIAANRDYDNDIWNLSAGGAFNQQQSTSTGEDETTQQTVSSDVSYKRVFDETYYGGLGVKYLYDKVAAIDYRATLKPGLGRFLVREEGLKVSVEAGPGYIFERVGSEARDFFAPFIGNRVDWDISPTAKLFQTAEALLDTSNTSNVIVNAEVGIEAAINSTLSLVVSVLDNYTGEPAEGKESNDLTFGTALKVAL